MQAAAAPGGAAPVANSSGRKRAGAWLNSDIDLDKYKTSKRYKQQEFARELGTLHLDKGPAAAAAQHAAQASTGPSPDPPESPMVSADGGSPMQLSQPASVQMATPRSESRTPSMQTMPAAGGAMPGPNHGGGGGGAICSGQPSVQSSGLRSRLSVGQTPVRLSDALNLQQLPPTSPSDPALDGLDLRKATLKRRLQTRLAQAGSASAGKEEAAASSPSTSAHVAAAGGAEGRQGRSQQQQQQQPAARGPAQEQAGSLQAAPLPATAANWAVLQETICSNLAMQQRRADTPFQQQQQQQQQASRRDSVLEESGCSSMQASPTGALPQ